MSYKVAFSTMGAECAEEAIPCGTYGGYQQHRRRKDLACEPCKEAAAAYMRHYRNRKGPGNDRWWNTTYDAALRRLAAEYPGRFASLLSEIRENSAAPWDPEQPS